MSITSVIFADVSTLKIGGLEVEAAQSFQASRPYTQQAIYGYDSPTPKKIVPIPGIGQGSFTYVASNSTTSQKDWADTLNGNGEVQVVGEYTGGAFGTQELIFRRCLCSGQSVAMSVRGEMVVTVSFVFGNGSTF